ncbi:MAG: glycosyltransferase [Solobacterium sp.]|nr:glycosyltransferase [Solobacterium sp.]
MMLTAAIAQFNLQIRTAIVETDYWNTPGSINNDLDCHFVPYATLVHELVNYGIDEKRIVVSGIPVRNEATTMQDKAKAKAELGIPEGRAHVLVMGGSMGGGSIPSLVEQLYETVNDISDISIICGTNEKLEKSIQAKYEGCDDIHIYGYVKDMARLYSGADVFVTKPGGISTTEAAVNGLPMVLLKGAAFCEEFNLNFFVGHGAALSGETEEDLSNACRTLLEHEEMRNVMAEILRRIGNRNASKIIYETIEQTA